MKRECVNVARNDVRMGARPNKRGIEMIGKIAKGIAYTAGFLALGTIGVSIVAYLENADYDVE